MSTIVLITPGKGFAILLALKSTPSTSPYPTARRSLCVPLLCSEILNCPHYNNFLFVKTSADYIITKLTDSTLVNFSQSEYFVCTRFNFCLMRLFSILCLLVLCQLGIHRIYFLASSRLFEQLSRTDS